MLKSFIETAIAGAATPTPCTPPCIAPIGTPIPAGIEPKDFLNGIYGKSLTLLMLVAGGAAVLFLIYNGILYITGGGLSTIGAGADAKKVQKAKDGIINAIIGIVIITSAYTIIRIATTISFTLSGVVNATPPP